MKVVNFEYNNQTFNVNYDLVWSFKYALVGGSILYQGGFTTFLRQPFVALSGGGGYEGLGYTGLETTSDNGNLLAESQDVILAENDVDIIIDQTPTIVPSTSGIPGAFLAVAFDTAGVFALSSNIRDGVGIGSITPNSLIIRGGEPGYSLLYNLPLTSIDTAFNILSTEYNYCWLRFRLGDICSKLYIDYRYDDSSQYTPLTSLPVSLSFNAGTQVNVGVSFATPLTSTDSYEATFNLMNFHIEGSTTAPLSTTYSQLTSVGETILTAQSGGNVATQDEHIVLT